MDAVRRIYAPGALLWIISDGHVFSDCIGVNDATVSMYDDMFRQNYHRSRATQGNPCIKFLGLEDLLFSRAEAVAAFRSRWLDGVLPQHPVETVKTTSAETSRKLLMVACEIDRSNLRSKVIAQDSPTLALYRGHSRFMYEDLSHTSYLALSSSKRKKLASAVATEMIIVSYFIILHILSTI